MSKSLLRIDQIPFLKDFKKPLFERGTLMYEKSGHSLTFSNGYYICTQKLKQKCNDKNEKNLKADVFERKFTRHIESLKLDEIQAHMAVLQITQDFIPLKNEFMKENLGKKDIYDATLDAITSELKDNRNIIKKDKKDLKEVYQQLLRAYYPNFLFFFLSTVFIYGLVSSQNK